ncbi:MAG: IS1380 family transposase [Actinomycetota bacterium]|nr:IS1380 family transposase [Actinomycetota bacterium]
MNATKAAQHVKVTADGKGVAGHVGSLLLAEVADHFGLTVTLSAAMAHTRQRRSAHDPGVVLAQLAVMLADGGDCVSDLATLRDQPELFGHVASTPTAWRVIDSVHAEGLRRIATARAAARAGAWAAGARPETITLDFDATLVTAHSDKEEAAPTYKHGFGFHPLLCYLDETGEALAGRLRPGNAGANCAADHVAVLDEALAQLPVRPRTAEHPDGTEMLARADSAGATHAFVEALRDRGVGFSLGHAVDDQVRQAIGLVQEEDWAPAISAEGGVRKGAWVVELTPLVELGGWGEGTRMLCRRERPHPGAQLRFSDVDGFRYQVFITDQDEGDVAVLEARHRAHARVEDRIRAAKQCGLENFPFEDFVRNQVWLLLVLMAQDLTAWAQLLCLDGELARAEPKRLRYCLFHAAAAVARRARRIVVRVQRSWPWAADLARAFERLRALPA